MKKSKAIVTKSNVPLNLVKELKQMKNVEDLPECKDCGKKLSVKWAKRCHKCQNIIAGKELVEKYHFKGEPWNKGKTGIMPIPWNKGKKLPELSLKMKGNQNWKFKKTFKHTQESIEKMKKSHLGQKAWNKGIPNLDATGEKNINWKGGVTPANEKIRKSPQSINWKRLVFEKNDYICQICGQKGGKLCAHHILPFRDFPEYRFRLDNGIALCRDCHKPTIYNEWKYVPIFMNV